MIMRRRFLKYNIGRAHNAQIEEKGTHIYSTATYLPAVLLTSSVTVEPQPGTSGRQLLGSWGSGAADGSRVGSERLTVE